MEDISPKFKVLSAEEEIVQPELFQDTPTQTTGGAVNRPFETSADSWQEKVQGYNYNRSGVDTMAYASAITLDTQAADLHKTTTVHATGNATINASTGGIAGQRMEVMIVNDATGAKTITFGTNFSPSATVVGTASKKAIISFISDGTTFYETARTLLLT